jgi:beta-glucosidase/6-phospho-beta-glucosidase/beta-galactosidase
MRAKYFLITVFTLITITSFSQDARVSEEELTKYATVMDSINEMTIAFQATLSDMVKSSEAMNGARYNELSRIATDETKLAEAKATPEEIAFLTEVAEIKKTETLKINQAFQSLAKDYLGAATYNKVKKALAADAELKAKYDSLIEEMAKDNEVSVEAEG